MNAVNKSTLLKFRLLLPSTNFTDFGWQSVIHVCWRFEMKMLKMFLLLTYENVYISRCYNSTIPCHKRGKADHCDYLVSARDRECVDTVWECGDAHHFHRRHMHQQQLRISNFDKNDGFNLIYWCVTIHTVYMYMYAKTLIDVSAYFNEGILIRNWNISFEIG